MCSHTKRQDQERDEEDYRLDDYLGDLDDHEE
jgi:hypothetical protein